MQVYGKPLVYLDNAASAQKPQAVLDRLNQAYTSEYANVHRGLHYLANAATEGYEGAREKVRAFLNAERPEEIIFTRNATEAINLVAYTFARERIQPGDEIVLSIMEHHSNIVPWHFLRERHGAVIKWAPVDEDGNFLLDEFEKLLTPRTKMVAMTHMSNALGTIVPIKEVVRIAHARGIPVLVDGSQAAVHLEVDVQDIGCDFYVITGHKLYGPTGIGALYGKYEHLAAMRPFNGGGEMIKEVFEDRIIYGEPPHKFEAGTPPIVQAIGLGAAIDYVQSIGKARIRAHENDVVKYAHQRLTRDQFAAHHRQCQGKGRDRLVRDEGRASARRRDRHRPCRRRGAGRHALRDAAARALWRDRDLPRVVRALQHQGGGRYAGAGLDQGAGHVRMSEETKTADPRRRRTRSRPRGGSAIPAEELGRMTDDIIGALKTVYDPEIPADIYELGLIYKVDIADDRAVDGRHDADHAELPVGAGTAHHGRERSVERRGRRPGDGEHRVGPALGSEPHVGRGACDAEHVVRAGWR